MTDGERQIIEAMAWHLSVSQTSWETMERITRWALMLSERPAIELTQKSLAEMRATALIYRHLLPSDIQVIIALKYGIT